MRSNPSSKSIHRVPMLHPAALLGDVLSFQNFYPIRTMRNRTITEENSDWLWRGQPGRQEYKEQPLIPHHSFVRRTLIPLGSTYWGGHVLPMAEQIGHALEIGTSRSGKSNLLNIRIDSVIKTLHQGNDRRIFCVDTKGDVIDIFEARGVPYIVYNPTDRDSWDWDIAKDHRSPNSLYQLACTLIPQGRETNPFWTDAARAILAGSLIALQSRYPGAWTLGDAIIMTLFPMEELIPLLKACPGNSFLAHQLQAILDSGDLKLASSLQMTLYANVAKLIPAAANSQRASRRFTLHDFLERSQALVVVPDQEALETVIPPFHAMMSRLTAMLANQPDSVVSETYFFLDELSFLGKIPNLAQLVTFTASKGGKVEAATQGIGRMKEDYGEGVLADILECFTWKTILRTQDPYTANWAASLFGVRGDWVRTPNLGEYGHQHQWLSRPLVTNFEIMHGLPFASPQAGVTAYFLPGSSPQYREALPYKGTVSAPTINLLNPRLTARRRIRQFPRSFAEQLLDPNLFLMQHRRVVEKFKPENAGGWEEAIVNAYRANIRPLLQNLMARAFEAEVKATRNAKC